MFGETNKINNLIRLTIFSGLLFVIFAFTNQAHAASYQFQPTSGTLVTGTEQAITSATAAAAEGTNTGSWKATLADDNFQWGVASTASGIDMQLNVDGVALNGANKMIVATEIDLDATVPNVKIQICDWVSTSSVDNAADAQCTGGGWRTLNTQNNSNVDINFTGTTAAGMQWHIYDGYFTTGTTGGTAISTPLSNFINSGSNNKVKVRYYSTINTTSVVHVDFLRVTALIDSVYYASGFTNLGSGGAVSGSYVNTSPVGNTASASLAGSDDVRIAVPGTSTAPQFYFSYTGIKTYTGMNTIVVRSEYSCSATDAALSITPRIYNFNSASWETLSSTTITCSNTDANNAWAKNNVTISNYISSGEIRVGWIMSAPHATTTLRVDFQYVMLGTTNSDSSQCEISIGTGTATDCANTRTLDTLASPSVMAITSEDESTNIGTGESNSYYPFDIDMDATATEEGAAANITFSVTAPSNSQVVGENYALRHAGRSAGSTATTGIGIFDYSGLNTPGSGSWLAIGGTSTSSSQTYVDSVSQLAISSYGQQLNPEDYIHTGLNKMNLRVRTTVDAAAGDNNVINWDFAFVSLQWIEPTSQASRTYQFTPTSETLVTGTDSAVTAQTAAAAAGVNVGSWKGTLADDNFHWTVTGTAGGLDAQLNVAGVQLNGANRMVIETEVDLDAAVALKVQICDWVSSTSVDNAADAQCTTGGWRTLNTQDATNADLGLTTTTTPTFLYWPIYNGYFNTGSAGGTPISTPLSNFINVANNNTVKIRYFSSTASAVADIDYLRIYNIIDSVYYPAAFTNLGTGGTVTGTYTNAHPLGNTTTATLNGSDDVRITVPGTSTASQFYFSYTGVQTYTGMNTILVRGEYGCVATGPTITPRIYNFNSASWENLTAAIACAVADANSVWAKNNVTISDYISSGEIRVGWIASAAHATAFTRIDFQYIMLGTTNTDSAQCEIPIGTGTATNCTNTRDLDALGSTNVMAITAEDESTNMGTGESNSYYPFDTDGDATASEEASAASVSFSVTVPSNAAVVGEHYAVRYAGRTLGTTAIEQSTLADYSGGMNSTQGGKTAIGAQASASTQTYTDSLTALAAASYGMQSNPEDYVHTGLNQMNMKLRTSTDGASTDNNVVNWDFAFVSIQWIDTTPGAGGFTVSGKAYQTDGTTALGSAKTVAVRKNGTLVGTGDGGTGLDDTDASGNWTIGGVTATAGDTITIYLNAETEKGNTITITDGASSITGVNVYDDHVIIQSNNGATAITILDILDYDNDQNSTDMLFDAEDASPDTLIVEDGNRLLIETSSTFTPGGTVTTDVSTSAASVDGDLTIRGTLSMGTNALSVGGDFLNSGTFSKSSGQTITFTATAASHTITDGGSNFDSIVFNGASGGWSFADATTLDAALTMTAGTLSGTNNITVGTDVIGTAGVINLTGGTFEQRVSASEDFGPTTTNTDWIFNNLTFSRATGTPTITKQSCSTCDINVTGTMLVSKTGDGAATTLNAGDATWTLSNSNSAAPFDDDQASGVLTAATSTFVYAGDNDSGDVTIENATWNNLTLGNGVAENYAPATTLNIGGNLVLNSTATLNGSQSINVTGTVTGNGTISVTGGVFMVDGSSFGGDTAWTFNHLKFGDGTGTVTTSASGSGAITVNGTMTVNTNQTLDAGSKTWNLPGAGSGIKIVNVSSRFTDVSVTSGTHDIGFTPTVGNHLFVVVAGWRASAFDLSTVADNQGGGNTWAIDAKSASGSNSRAAVASTKVNTASGSFQVTLTAGGSASSMEWNVIEVSGLDATTHLDRTGTTTSSSTSTTVNASAQNTSADDIVFAAISVSVNNANVTVSDPANTGYTSIGVNQNATATIGYEGSYKIVSATETSSANWTHISATGTAAAIATYKKATSYTPLTVSGSFTPNASNIVYKTNTNYTVPALTYYDLTLNPTITSTDKTYTLGGAQTINHDFNINPDAGSALNLGVSLAGTTTITGTLTIQKSNSATSSLTTTGSNHALNAGAINIASGGTLAGNDSTITLTGSGTPFTVNGTFTPGTGNTVVYNSTGATNIGAATYNHLSLTPAGVPVYTLGTAGSQTINAVNLTIGNGAQAVAVNHATWDPAINISGNLTISAAAGTFTKSDAAAVITLKPTGTKTWTDATNQDIGVVVIGSGTSTPKINLGGSVKATSLNLNSSHELDFNGANTLTLTGSGAAASRPLIISGTFTPGTTSTVAYTGTSNSEIESATYNNLSLIPAGTPTYKLGTATSQTINVNNLTIGNGSNGVAIDHASYDPAINITGNFSINTSAGTFTKSDAAAVITLKPAGTKTWTDATNQDIGVVVIGSGSSTPKINLASNVKATSVNINSAHELDFNGTRTMTLTSNSTPLTIGGTLTDTNGTFAFVPSSTGTVTIPTRNYFSIQVDGSGSTFRPAAGTLFLNNNLSITNGTLDLDTNDPTTVVQGMTTIGGTLSASNANPITFAGTIANNGTFTHNSGTVVFNPISNTLGVTGSTATTSFNNLTVTGLANKTVTFKAGNTYAVTGLLSLGGDGANPLNIFSDTPGAPWFVTFTGTSAIAFVRLRDAGCTGGNPIPLAETVVNLGNNGTCWLLIHKGNPIIGNGDGSSGGGTGAGGGGFGGGGGVGGGGNGGSGGGGGTLPQDFTGSNGTALVGYDPSWEVLNGAFALNTNAVFSNAAAQDTMARWTVGTFNDNQFAEMGVTAVGTGYIGVGVRLQSGAHSGYGAYCNNQDIKIIEWNAGTPTTHYTGSACTAFDVIRLEISGTSITLKRNGSTLTSVTDSTFSTGRPGLVGNGNSTATRGDIFYADSIASQGGGGGGGGGGGSP